MRDEMGRERMSWAVPVGDPRVSLSEKLRTVVVLDPVARCVFLWIEDQAGKAADAAKVRCEPEGLEVPARPAWNALSGWETGELVKEPESKPHFEDVPIGTEEIGGVSAKGFRHEEVRTFDEGKRVERENLGQRWYSAALDMVVRATEGEESQYFERDQVSFAISEVKLGEPPVGSFAPGAGAKVVVDPKLALAGEPRGRISYLYSARQGSRTGEWPNLSLMAMTDQAGRLLHPAFPESWYVNGPTTAMPAFYRESAGKPYDAVATLRQYGPDAKTSSDVAQTAFVSVSRDSEARIRLTLRFLNGGPRQVVYVLDPVAGCIFAWYEMPAYEGDARTKPAGKEAKVRCNARGVVVPGAPRWDEPNDDEKAQIAAAGPDKLQFVNERVGEEQVGDSGEGQVATVKYARYAVHTSENGRPGKKVKVEELWYSPELDMVVKVALAPRTSGPTAKGKELDLLPALEFNSVEMREPPEDFYPPYGYEIKVDETLLPPFAPAPAKADPAKAAGHK
jgi:hypothetical protein